MELLQGKRLYRKIKKLNVNFYDYILYMSDEKHISDWHGVSIQQELVHTYELSQRNISLKKQFLSVPNPPYSEVLIENFSRLMKLFLADFISMDSSWIILRDNNRRKWLSDLKETSIVKNNVINLFKKENIDLNYRGAFFLSNSSLMEILFDLIRFPYYNKSEDINLLNDKSDCIIRFTHHFSIEFVSEKRGEIKDFLSKVKRLNLFKIIEYR